MRFEDFHYSPNVHYTPFSIYRYIRCMRVHTLCRDGKGTEIPYLPNPIYFYSINISHEFWTYDIANAHVFFSEELHIYIYCNTCTFPTIKLFPRVVFESLWKKQQFLLLTVFLRGTCQSEWILSLNECFGNWFGKAYWSIFTWESVSSW